MLIMYCLLKPALVIVYVPLLSEEVLVHPALLPVSDEDTLLLESRVILTV
jgi:hypothetical protein